MGNPQRSRKVACPTCRYERTTSSRWPYCKLCKQRMLDKKAPAHSGETATS